MISGKITCDYCGKRITDKEDYFVFHSKDGMATGRTDMCACCYEKALTAINGFRMVKVRE